MSPILLSKRVTVALALLLPALSAGAQQPAVSSLRGRVTAVDDSKLTIATREGASVSVALKSETRLTGLSRIQIGDITPDSYVGVAAVPQSEGVLKALSVHVFPESMRGAGEGSFASDVAPGGSMTNGAVDETVTSNDGRRLKVRYKTGEKTILVDKDTSLVAFQPGAQRSELVPGVAVVVRATKTEAGDLVAVSVLIGRNGVVPAL